MTVPASAGGNSVPVIANLVRADEDAVRDVIHRFNEIGLACLGGPPLPARAPWRDVTPDQDTARGGHRTERRP